MKDSLVNLTYEIELEPGEKLTLPESLIAQVDAGRWLITIRPLSTPIRSHSAFLNFTHPKMRGCMTTIHPGVFWVAEIPFTDGSASKMGSAHQVAVLRQGENQSDNRLLRPLGFAQDIAPRFSPAGTGRGGGSGAAGGVRLCEGRCWV